MNTNTTRRNVQNNPRLSWHVKDADDWIVRIILLQAQQQKSFKKVTHDKMW